MVRLQTLKVAEARAHCHEAGPMTACLPSAEVEPPRNHWVQMALARTPRTTAAEELLRLLRTPQRMMVSVLEPMDAVGTQTGSGDATTAGRWAWYLLWQTMVGLGADATVEGHLAQESLCLSLMQTMDGAGESYSQCKSLQRMLVA